MTTSAIRVLCIDDHPLVRDGVTRKIDGQPGMCVVGTGSSGEEAVALHKELAPDVTILDLNLPEMTGIEALVTIRERSPDARIIVLTMYQGDEDIHRALEAGAAAYLLKTTVADDLIQAIIDVHTGGRSIPADVATHLAYRSGHVPLTRREISVVDLMSRGCKNKEIADNLGISEDTVEVHARNIFSKLGVRDRTAAVTLALRRGIIHLAR